MAGIYFHIPFCKRLCGYCDFNRTLRLQYVPRVLERMHAELDAERLFLHDRKIRTVYFGGGTPSLLAPQALAELLEHTTHLFDCSRTEEITVELNPDDVTPEYAEALRRTPINRLSIGIQSFDDAELRAMGRRHTAAQAEQAVRLLQNAGYDNISIDLIFGVHGFGGDVLQRSLDKALSLGVQHISAYHLTIEPDTRFGRMLARGELRQVDEECSEREFLAVHDALTAAGFEHYEVSNYALSGFRSRHNSSYWTGDEYLGIGAGAHSFDGSMRRWCEQSAEEYAEGIVYGQETLSERDSLNEYLMTSLRRIEGISPTYIAEHWGSDEAERIGRTAEAFIKAGTMARLCEGADERLAIPPEHFLVSDAIISAMFEV
ncbi:MAG: radical SAM family heme chaperone HemW [Alistipes sp.]